MFDVFYLDNPTGLFPHERKARSIEHARELSRTRYLWVVSGFNDYSDFDFTWHPTPWQANQAHVWPSQHQDNGGTWLLPRSAHTDVNRDHHIITRDGSAPVLHIRHCADSAESGDVSTRYISDYLGTLRRALSKLDWEYCWVTSDICDYTDFDFTWHPSEWQTNMLHVFASNEQKFGDTFYVHVPSFLAKSKDLALLEWFDTLHFVESLSVPRQDPPQVFYDTDSVVPAVWAHDFRDPVVMFCKYRKTMIIPTINLWRQETRAITPLTNGAGNVIVPREAKNFIKTQMYDYPVINRDWQMLKDPPLDIVFISNGEFNAEHHWEYLKSFTVLQKSIQQRVVRVDGVNGRVAAYQAAARASESDWFFAVFAKLEVTADFDWSWQPDRMQQPKHYIFHAHNPVNGLVYGHQAMIAYNKRLVLENTGEGLDFTLDQPHEVVPIVSGTAMYHESDWMCWRTAFREVLKLKASLPDVESEHRLNRWLTVDTTAGQWSRKGAEDGVEYYDSVGGDFAALKKSYEWDWLATYAFMKRSLTPNQ